MCRAARRLPRRCFTACCCCRRRSGAPARSSAEPRQLAEPSIVDDTLKELGLTIAAGLPDAVTGHHVAFGDLVVTARAAEIVRVMTFLRDDPRCQFWCIIDVTAVDWPAR